MKKLYILVGLFVAMGVSSGVSAVSAERFKDIVEDKEAAVRLLLLNVKRDKSAPAHHASLENIITLKVNPLIKELKTEMASKKSTDASRKALLLKQSALWKLVLDALTTEVVVSGYDDPFCDGLNNFIFPELRKAE